MCPRSIGLIEEVALTTVARTHHAVGRHNGLTTLEQRFHFDGVHVDADAIARVLASAPLVGDGSIFGDRPGKEIHGSGAERAMEGFSPAPGFRFDVVMSEREPTVFVVRFAQPDRTNPYLQGDLVWLLGDEGNGASLNEQINTERALESGGQPLGGPRPSLRRWLFFRAGHRAVMSAATRNIASLLDWN